MTARLERRTRIRLDNHEEVCTYVIEPTIDSDIDDLEDDDDGQSQLEDNDFEYTGIEEDEEGDDMENEDGDTTDTPDQVEPEPEPEKRSFRWRRKEPPIGRTVPAENEFSRPPPEELTPLEYFRLFWDKTITENIVEQTNLYSVQKNGTSINTNVNEMEQFIGVQMKMSYVSMPKYNMYWSRGTRYDPIASVMSINRYKKLRQNIHFADNSKKDLPENKNNRLYKISPVVDAVRANCLKIEKEKILSVDEQIIPAKTKYSGIRQYNPRKPVKWGFKNFVLAGKSGFMYDFFSVSYTHLTLPTKA